jgi:hypothetical protein
MPVAALLPTIIGAGGSALGGWLGGRKSGEEKAALGAQTSALQSQTKIGEEAAGAGRTFTGLATPALTNALNFWQTVLGGDRTTLSSLLGPELSRYASGQQQAMSQVSQFAPRGGGRTSTLAEMPFTTARATGDLFSTLRPQAAGQLGSLGTNVAQLGLGAFGVGSGAQRDVAQGYLAQVQAAQRNREWATMIGGKLGSSLWTEAKKYDWSTWPPKAKTAG